VRMLDCLTILIVETCSSFSVRLAVNAIVSNGLLLVGNISVDMDIASLKPMFILHKPMVSRGANSAI
jgi:hypothetical protein